MSFSQYPTSTYAPNHTRQAAFVYNNHSFKSKRNVNFSSTSVRHVPYTNPYVFKPRSSNSDVPTSTANRFASEGAKTRTVFVSQSSNKSFAKNSLNLPKDEQVQAPQTNNVPCLAELEQRVKALASKSPLSTSSALVIKAPGNNPSSPCALVPKYSKYKKCNTTSEAGLSSTLSQNTQISASQPVRTLISPKSGTKTAYKVLNRTKLIRKSVSSKGRAPLDKNSPLLVSRTKLIRKTNKSPVSKSKVASAKSLSSTFNTPKKTYSPAKALKLKTRYKLVKKCSPFVSRTPVLVNSRFRLIKGSTGRPQFLPDKRSFNRNPFLRTSPYFHVKHVPFRFAPTKRNKAGVEVVNRKLVKLRDARFESRNNGKTLRRLGSQISAKPKLQAQSVVNTAMQVKHRSIATLINSRRKVNLPCLVYNRLGKCARHQKGFCSFVHDPNRVAVCRGFLAGRCQKEDCLLSHKIDAKKLPTCQFFLKGACMKGSECPFRHVNVGADAPVCVAFTNGYCALGEKCPKKHELKPPPTKKTFVKRAVRGSRTKARTTTTSDRPQQKKDAVMEEANQRYFQSDLQSMRQRILERMAKMKGETVTEDSSNKIPSACLVDEEGNRIRPPVGDLPAFISI